jgi:hypothetical protein
VDILIQQFIDARQFLLDHLDDMANVYFTCIWDPLMKFTIIKETNIILDKMLIKEFPDFPKQYFPKVKFRIYEEDHEIEAGVQAYLNTTPSLIFLGTSDLGDSEFDFYIRKSFDPSVEYMFFARYGHTIDNVYTGAKVAAAEYFQGAMTPLSVAFGMAVEDGFIA